VTMARLPGTLPRVPGRLVAVATGHGQARLRPVRHCSTPVPKIIFHRPKT
jgi:hypothetical protein